MMKKIAIVLFAVLAVFALAGCRNVRISKPASTDLKLTLLSNPSTGCSWMVKIEDENIATYLGSEYNQAEAPEGMVGVGGTETLYFRTQNPGETKVYLEYGHSWSGEVYNSHIAVITVKEDMTGKITMDY